MLSLQLKMCMIISKPVNCISILYITKKGKKLFFFEPQKDVLIISVSANEKKCNALQCLETIQGRLLDTNAIFLCIDGKGEEGCAA